VISRAPRYRRLNQASVHSLVAILIQAMPEQKEHTSKRVRSAKAAHEPESKGLKVERMVGAGSRLIDAVDTLVKRHVVDTVDPSFLPSVAKQTPAETLVRHWIENHVPVSQIQEITSLAINVLGDTNQALDWLMHPNLATDNKPPVDLIAEQEGFERVKNLLLRIEFGVLA
jgi:uncharacterized protein (DUF2384 family)